MTYREMIYIVLEQVKGLSDDFKFNEEHVKFLLDRYRSYYIKKYYSQATSLLPQSLFQTKTIELEEYGDCCSNQLRSVDKIPDTLIGSHIVTTANEFGDRINFLPSKQYKAAGNSKFYTKGIFATIGSDKHLYIKSNNPNISFIECVSVSGVFDNPSSIINNEDCEPLDIEFPIDGSLAVLVIQSTINDLTNSAYKQSDVVNDGRDGIENMPNNVAAALAKREQRRQKE